MITVDILTRQILFLQTAAPIHIIEMAAGLVSSGAGRWRGPSRPPSCVGRWKWFGWRFGVEDLAAGKDKASRA